MSMLIGMMQHYPVLVVDGKKTDMLSPESINLGMKNGENYINKFNDIVKVVEDFYIIHSIANRTFQSGLSERMGIPNVNMNTIIKQDSQLNIPGVVSDDIRNIKDLGERAVAIFDAIGDKIIDSAFKNAGNFVSSILSYTSTETDPDEAPKKSYIGLAYSHDLVTKGTYLVLSGQQINPDTLKSTGFIHGGGFLFKVSRDSNITCFKKNPLENKIELLQDYSKVSIIDNIKSSSELNKYHLK